MSDFSKRDWKCLCSLNKRPPCKKCRGKLKAYRAGLKKAARMARARAPKRASGCCPACRTGWLPGCGCHRDIMLKLAADLDKLAERKA